MKLQGFRFKKSIMKNPIGYLELDRSITLICT